MQPRAPCRPCQNVAQHLIYMAKGIKVSHSFVAQMHAALDMDEQQ